MLRFKYKNSPHLVALSNLLNSKLIHFQICSLPNLFTSKSAYFQTSLLSKFFLYLPALCSANLALWSRKLDHESLQRLESFQGEVAKRILKLPRWYSNTPACVALDMESMHSVCTVRKLRFLHRVTTNEESICYRAFSAMVDDVEALRRSAEIWRKDMDLILHRRFSMLILQLAHMKQKTSYIVKEDKALQLKKSSKFCHPNAIADSVGWRNSGTWHLTMDHLA